MAESAVLNIAKSLIEQLSSPAKDEFRLWYSSKAELDKLKNTITCIKDVLHDAEQKKATNTGIGGWLSRLQDEMYKADDLFDAISTRALRKQVISGNKFKREMMVFFSRSNQVAFFVKTAHKVKELREQLDDIAKDVSQFGLIRSAFEYDQMSQRIAVKRKAEHSFIAEDEVIGREEDKQELLRLLMADAGVEERVSVIAVVGIGGQGKTAIAQLLYHSKEVEELFELRLWACVNYFSDLKQALEEITGTKSHSLDELQNRLRAKINGKRFLLVIDDVWDEIREQWLDLERLLKVGESGSKVLITTRSQTVAQNLATVRLHYDLGELSDEDGWILFKKMAFDSNEREEDNSKEELGRKIFKKCPKVPLAIRTVGSFLYGKDKKQWLAFVDNELMKAMPDRENLVMQALKISYDDLPPSLKHCFTYCSLFTKDHRLDKTILIRLWMAQGLLKTSYEYPCLEEAGESNFLYLVQRGFFQNLCINDAGEIISCKMHDLFHDLAVEINGNECQSKLKVTDELESKVPRHLLVKDIKESWIKCKELRSLVCSVTGFVERGLLDGVFFNLTSLRTLYLRELVIEEIPSSIGKLTHLRYLDLMGSDKLIKLQDALCKLQNLLILNLEGCKSLIKLPDDLRKLISLRCLTLRGCDQLEDIPSRLEEMTCLVTLDRLILHKDRGGLRCLKHLNNLTGRICIELPGVGWKDCVVDAEDCMLSRKTKLSGLSISWSRTTTGEEFPEADIVLDRLHPSDHITYLDFECFPGSRLPNWVSSLHSLVELRISECSRCSDLGELKHLFHLKRMVLQNIPFTEYLTDETCYDSGPFLPSLEYLRLFEMRRLKGWWKPKGEEVGDAYHDDLWLPRLSRLIVNDCPNLTTLPLCPSVEDIHLSRVSGILMTQMMRSPKAIKLKANSSSTVPTCSKLTKLYMFQIKDLSLVPDDFKDMSLLRSIVVQYCPGFKQSSLFSIMQNLPSLESTSFVKCDTTEECLADDVENMRMRDSMQWSVLTRLKHLDFDFGKDALVGGQLLKGLHHLTRLERLSINMNDMPINEDMQCITPPNLKHLIIRCLKEVTAALNGLIHQSKNLQSLNFVACRIDEDELDKLQWEEFKGVRKLWFHYAKSIKSLPEKCQHLLALDEVYLSQCDGIISLPDWVSRLTSLTIIGCPGLKEACRKPMGSCWPLVQDIPYLSIRD